MKKIFLSIFLIATFTTTYSQEKINLKKKQICYELLQSYLKFGGQSDGRTIIRSFTSKDFSDSSIQIVWKILNVHRNNYLTYLIAGNTGQTKFLEPLKKILDSISDKDLYMPINEALARLGDKDAINICIQNFYLEYKTDKEKALHLDYLLYIKQPEILKIIIPLLKSSGVVPNTKTPLNLKVGTPFKRYAMDAVKELFIDFPMQDRGLGEYSEEQVQTTLELLKNPTKYQLNK